MSMGHAIARGHADLGGLCCQLISGSLLLPRTTFRSEVLLEPGSALISVIHVTTRGHVNVLGLC